MTSTVETSSAHALLGRLQQYDYSPVIRTLMEESSFTEQRAQSLIEAFQQWFSAIPLVTRGSIYVMLKTDVDEVFHACVLNTAWWREFCQTFLGRFVDHTPLDPYTRERVAPGVAYTLDLLDRTYGKNLHPELLAWRPGVEAGQIAVSCMSCDDDDDEFMARTLVAHAPNDVKLIH